MKFISFGVGFHLYKSTMLPWIPCLGCASSYYFDMLDKLQKWVCEAVVLLVASSFEPLAHHQNVASLSLSFFSIFITFLDVHLNCLKSFHSLILMKALLVILIICMTFLLPYLDVIRMSMSRVSLHCQTVQFAACRMIFLDLYKDGFYNQLSNMLFFFVFFFFL